MTCNTPVVKITSYDAAKADNTGNQDLYGIRFHDYLLMNADHTEGYYVPNNQRHLVNMKGPDTRAIPLEDLKVISLTEVCKLEGIPSTMENLNMICHIIQDIDNAEGLSGPNP